MNKSDPIFPLTEKEILGYPDLPTANRRVQTRLDIRLFLFFGYFEKLEKRICLDVYLPINTF